MRRPALFLAALLALLAGCAADPGGDAAPDEGASREAGARWQPRPGTAWQWQLSGHLDIRRTDVLEPLMAARLDMCRAKGFDAVEPDNMDGYRNKTGFPLTAADQLRYNRLLARLAHERGMAVGLKNDLDQIPDLVGDFDFAVNEQCAQYGECADLKPFVAADKAVFHVEYELPTSRFCVNSLKLGLSSMLKKYDLGTWRRAC